MGSHVGPYVSALHGNTWFLTDSFRLSFRLLAVIAWLKRKHAISQINKFVNGLTST